MNVQQKRSKKAILDEKGKEAFEWNDDPEPSLLSFVDSCAVFLASFHDMPALTSYFEPSPRSLNKMGQSDSSGILQQRVSLRDPISLRKIKLPVRGLGCKHLQCCDHETYLAMNCSKKFNTSESQCPLCNAWMSPHNIYIDYVFLCIIEQRNKEMGADFDEEVDCFIDGYFEFVGANNNEVIQSHSCVQRTKDTCKSDAEDLHLLDVSTVPPTYPAHVIIIDDDDIATEDQTNKKKIHVHDLTSLPSSSSSSSSSSITSSLSHSRPHPEQKQKQKKFSLNSLYHFSLSISPTPHANHKSTSLRLLANGNLDDALIILNQCPQAMLCQPPLSLTKRLSGVLVQYRPFFSVSYLGLKHALQIVPSIGSTIAESTIDACLAFASERKGQVVKCILEYVLGSTFTALFPSCGGGLGDISAISGVRCGDDNKPTAIKFTSDSVPVLIGDVTEVAKANNNTNDIHVTTRGSNQVLLCEHDKTCPIIALDATLPRLTKYDTLNTVVTIPSTAPPPPASQVVTGNVTETVETIGTSHMMTGGPQEPSDSLVCIPDIPTLSHIPHRPQRMHEIVDDVGGSKSMELLEGVSVHPLPRFNLRNYSVSPNGAFSSLTAADTPLSPPRLEWQGEDEEEAHHQEVSKHIYETKSNLECEMRNNLEPSNLPTLSDIDGHVKDFKDFKDSLTGCNMDHTTSCQYLHPSSPPHIFSDNRRVVDYNHGGNESNRRWGRGNSNSSDRSDSYGGRWADGASLPFQSNIRDPHGREKGASSLRTRNDAKSGKYDKPLSVIQAPQSHAREHEHEHERQELVNTAGTVTRDMVDVRMVYRDDNKRRRWDGGAGSRWDRRDRHYDDYDERGSYKRRGRGEDSNRYGGHGRNYGGRYEPHSNHTHNYSQSHNPNCKPNYKPNSNSNPNSSSSSNPHSHVHQLHNISSVSTALLKTPVTVADMIIQDFCQPL